MVLPAKANKNYDFEVVEVDDWLPGKIKDIQDRVNDKRKYKDEETGEWKFRTVNEVRFVFELEDYKFSHYSRWMTNSVGERATLYSKYLKKLIEGLKPDTDVDLHKLRDKKILVMYENEEYDGKTYQNVTQVRPQEVIPKEEILLVEAELEASNKEEMPF